jgi:hypothetical protein
MKRKKVKEKHRSPVSGMKSLSNTKRRDPVKRKRNIFKKKSKVDKGKKRRLKKVVSRIVLAIMIGILLGLAILSVRYVLNSRGNSGEEYEKGDILGIEGVPIYPRSTFLFEESKDTSTVQNFLMSGRSAYRLPKDTDRDDIHTYYEQQLLDSAWTYELSVEIGSEDMKYGEYWSKDNVGLRIYVKENSIWYETITVEEAKNGLEDRVKAEVERELLLASAETQDLLPDFPWVLKVPKEYVVNYQSSDIGDFRKVSFKKIGSDSLYSITPVGYYGGNTFDSYLYNYIDSMNTEGKEWGVQNSYYVQRGGKDVLLGDIVSPNGLLDAAVINNSYNTVVYVFLSASKEDPFFEYILENIQAQDNRRY